MPTEAVRGWAERVRRSKYDYIVIETRGMVTGIVVKGTKLASHWAIGEKGRGEYIMIQRNERGSRGAWGVRLGVEEQIGSDGVG